MNSYRVGSIILILLLIPFILLFTGCKKSSPQPDIELEPLEGLVELIIDEGVVGDYDTVGEPKFLLILKTEQAYLCGNCAIECEYSQVGSNLNIDIKGISIPEGGMIASRRATAMSYWDIENGEYQINVTYNDISDFATLTVTDDTFFLTPSTVETLILSEETLFWRYPENSFIYYYNEEDFIGDYHEAYSQSFGIMAQFDFLERFTFPSSGLNPYLPMGTNGVGGIRYFLYPTDQDVEVMFETIRQAHEGIDIPNDIELGINIQTWKNEYLLVL
jgi:hypothetical protein